MATTKSGGVESVDRALKLLRLIGMHNNGGVRFSDICSMSGMSQGTVHRLLRTLADNSFVDQDHTTRRYHLGGGFLTLGSAVANRINLQEAAEPLLRRVVNACGDTVVMCVPNGVNSLCVLRMDGAYPLKTMTVNVGSVRPLGFGSAALALLAFGPDAERDDLIRRVSYRAHEFPMLEEANLRRLVAETRAQGFAFLEGHVLRAMATLAVPIVDSAGNLQASASVIATVERLAPPRRNELLALLRQAAAGIGAQLSLAQAGVPGPGLRPP